MTDDEIRELLAALPQATTMQRPPGSVAIVRALVADDDLDAVDAWVAAAGGQIRKTRPVQAQSRRAGRITTETIASERYYLLPSAALRPAR